MLISVKVESSMLGGDACHVSVTGTFKVDFATFKWGKLAADDPLCSCFCAAFPIQANLLTLAWTWRLVTASNPLKPARKRVKTCEL